MSKKLSILTSNQEVGDFVSKTSSSKLKLSAHNAYDDGSGKNSFIFDLTSNQMIMSLYDEDNDESYEKIKVTSGNIILEDDISVKGTLTTENLSVTGTTTSINTNQYKYYSFGWTRHFYNHDWITFACVYPIMCRTHPAWLSLFLPVACCNI